MTRFKRFPQAAFWLVLSVIGLLSEGVAQNQHTYRFETAGWNVAFESPDSLTIAREPLRWIGINRAEVAASSSLDYWHKTSARITWMYEVANLSLTPAEPPAQLADWIKPWLRSATSDQDCVELSSAPQAIRFLGQDAVQLDYTSSSGSGCAPNEILYHRVVAFKTQNTIRMIVITCGKENWGGLKNKLERLQLSFHYAS